MPLMTVTFCLPSVSKHQASTFPFRQLPIRSVDHRIFHRLLFAAKANPWYSSKLATTIFNTTNHASSGLGGHSWVLRYILSNIGPISLHSKPTYHLFDVDATITHPSAQLPYISTINTRVGRGVSSVTVRVSPVRANRRSSI